MAVGAGGDGENELGALGSMPFSFGAPGAELFPDAGAELLGLLVGALGASLVALLHAVRAPIPTTAAPPATNAKPRIHRNTMHKLPSSELPGQTSAGRNVTRWPAAPVMTNRWCRLSPSRPGGLVSSDTDLFADGARVDGRWAGRRSAGEGSDESATQPACFGEVPVLGPQDVVVVLVERRRFPLSSAALRAGGSRRQPAPRQWVGVADPDRTRCRGTGGGGAAAPRTVQSHLTHIYKRTRRYVAGATCPGTARHAD